MTFSDWTDEEIRAELAPWDENMTDDDPSERITHPNGFQDPITVERLKRELAETLLEVDKWKTRYSVLRSRLTGIRDSLLKLDYELERICNDK